VNPIVVLQFRHCHPQGGDLGQHGEISKREEEISDLVMAEGEMAEAGRCT
jgi:hypothetical protein